MGLDQEEKQERQMKKYRRRDDPAVTALFKVILETEHVNYRKDEDEVRDEFCKAIGIGSDKCGEVWSEVKQMLSEAFRDAKDKVRDYLKNSTDGVFDLLVNGIALDTVIVNSIKDVGDAEFYTANAFDLAYIKFEEEVEKARSIFEKMLREKLYNISNYLKSKLS